MSLGASASEAIAVVCTSTDHIDYRQLTAVDAKGRSASFSGKHTLGINAAVSAQNVVCAGNLLSCDAVPDAMVNAFMVSEGHSLSLYLR